ncbi:MAG: filamentous hemagglutinin N-terminal domain-containing protein, partial [Alphaproteobacteria bacterium]|nr:filamentous hemagglutinin N-terminal domain-containing protein [Alphaproteobacteria bacterium]
MRKVRSLTRLLASTTSVVMLSSLLWLGADGEIAKANPADGVVAAGSATISEAGKKLDVHQASDRAVIDWRSFDIAVDEHTQFHQPSSSAVAVNRVNNTNPSQIMGQLSANGNVVLINPNGVFFGRDSVVDINGLIATTADVDNASVMAGGKLHFTKPGNPNARIVNQGTITAKQAGLVGLVAPNVENDGIITARLGKVHLASGDQVTVDLYGDGLMDLAVSDDVTSQLIRHTGSISAEGGTIALTAAAGRQIVDSLVKVEGELKAPTVAEHNGEIVIMAKGSNAVTDNVTAEKGKKSGQSTVLVSAFLDASGRKAGERGGKITITGDNVALLDGTIIDASGHSGKSGTTRGKKISDYRESSAGGDIRIGGDYLGQGTTPTAKNLYVSDGVLVLNDALSSGDAGRTIFWSDDTTQFYGNVYARALGGKAVDLLTWNATSGGNTGDGGFVETSGHGHLDAGGYVDLTASNGKRGTYFLDPTNITIYGNVDPAFQSTDGTVNLSANLKLWVDSSDTSAVQLTYSTDGLGTTATGTLNSNTITTATNVSANLAVGARIRLGSAGSVTAASTLGVDTYTIASISGTTITLTSNLTSNYSGSTLYRGLVSQVTDKSSSGLNATQSLENNMPLWISNGQNGIGTNQFDGTNDWLANTTAPLPSGTKSLTYFNTFVSKSNYSLQNGNLIYDQQGTGIGLRAGMMITNSNSTTPANNFRFAGQSNNADFGTVSLNNWYIGSLTRFDQSSNNVRGTFGAIDRTATITNSGIGNNWGYSIGVGITSTGNISLSSGAFSGSIGESLVYNSSISGNPFTLLQQYQSAKWGIALTPPGTGATEVAQATASDGYSVFTTRYLERLSQSADISLQATNNINLDLKGDTLNFSTANRSLSLTAGNQIATQSVGNITTNGGNLTFAATNGIVLNHALGLTTNGGNLNFNNNLTLGASQNWNAGSGTTSFAGTVNTNGTAAYNLTLNSGTISLAGAIGNTNSLGALSLTSTNSLTLPSITAQDLTIQANGSNSDITINGDITKTSGGDAGLILRAAGSIVKTDATARTISS